VPAVIGEAEIAEVEEKGSSRKPTAASHTRPAELVTDWAIDCGWYLAAKAGEEPVPSLVPRVLKAVH
jgi:hypothetical protein